MHRLPLFLFHYNYHSIARRRHGGGDVLYTTSAVTSAVTSASSSSYIVVGNGPIGSSIAKHLVQLLASANNNNKTNNRSNNNNNNNVTTTTPKVTIIDGKGVGVGSSHADRARLIRTFDAEGDEEWTKWNIRSLQSFPAIEKMWHKSSLLEESSNKNKSFFTNCGALLMGDEEFVRRSKTAADKATMMLSSSSSPAVAVAGKLPPATNKRSSSSTSTATEPIRMSPIECQKKWPFLKPKVGCDVALFDSSGGIIDPNAFIEAQNTITTAIAAATGTSSRNGTTIDDDNDNKNKNKNYQEATTVHPNNVVDFEIISDEVITVGRNMVELASSTRKTLSADTVIVCGGSYTKPLLQNSGYYCCDEKKKNSSSSKWDTIRSSKRIVALLEVSADLVEGILKDMPSIKYVFDLELNLNSNLNLNLNNEKIMPIPERAAAAAAATTAGEQSRVEAGSVYIIPPVWYPGEREGEKGKWCIKIGGGDNKWIDTKNEIDNWLFNNNKSGNNEDDEDEDDDDDGNTTLSVSRLEDILRSLMPNIQFDSVESMACVTTIDSNSSPQSNGIVVDDDNIEDGIIAISACQGKGAGPAEAVSKDIADKIYHNQIKQ